MKRHTTLLLVLTGVLISALVCLKDSLAWGPHPSDSDYTIGVATPTPSPTGSGTPSATATPGCFTATVGTSCIYHPAGQTFDIYASALVNNPGPTQLQPANFYLEASTDGINFDFIARTSIQNFTFNSGQTVISDVLAKVSIPEPYTLYRVRVQFYNCGIYFFYSTPQPICRPPSTPTPTPTPTLTPTLTPTPTPTPSLSPLPSPTPGCQQTYTYQVFGNPTPIVPADRVSNDPGTDPGLPPNYPSVIDTALADVPSVPDTCLVTRVTASFAITSERPDDLDILLEGPNGRSIVISDAGGSDPIIQRDYLFGGFLTYPLFPDDSAPPTGYYSQYNYPGLVGPEPNGMDNFPGVNGLSTYSALSFEPLSGGYVHGTWRLYVVDDETGNRSSLPNGWTISFLTMCQAGTPACSPTPLPTPTPTPTPTRTPTPTPTPSPFAELDLRVSQADSPDPVVRGQPLTYTVIVSNVPYALGGTACPVVRFGYPSGVPFTFVQASGTNGFIGIADAGGVTFSGGCLTSSGGNPPATAELTVVLTPQAAGTLTSLGTNVVVDPENLIYESFEDNNTAETVTTTVTINPATRFDYDGDRVADPSVYRPSNSGWYVLRSTGGFTGTSFGYVTDRIAPADFDGDGKTDLGVYRASAGTWYWLNSSNGTLSAVQFGASEDLPTPADHDGDGRADVSLFRPSNGVWYRLNSYDGSFQAVQFGTSGDKPTIGDYDGDGRADVAVFRPSNGVWYRLNSSNGGFVATQFGISSDLAVANDHDGDGRSDLAVYRPSQGTWYVLRSSQGFYAVQFGTATDIPAAADLDGDGKADITVFRPSDGVWYRLNSSNGAFIAVQFGSNGDVPTPSAFSY